MRRFYFFCLSLIYFFVVVKAQTFNSKNYIDVQLGTINGLNYEYFINRNISVGAFVNIPLGFNLYFKSADATSPSPNLYTHGLNIGGVFTSYWSKHHQDFIKSGWWVSGKFFLGIPWNRFFKSSSYNEENEKIISYKYDYNFELCTTAIVGYTFRPIKHLYINTGLGFTYSWMFLTFGSLNHVLRPCMDLSIGYIF